MENQAAAFPQFHNDITGSSFPKLAVGFPRVANAGEGSGFITADEEKVHLLENLQNLTRDSFAWFHTNVQGDPATVGVDAFQQFHCRCLGAGVEEAVTHHAYCHRSVQHAARARHGPKKAICAAAPEECALSVGRDVDVEQSSQRCGGSLDVTHVHTIVHERSEEQGGEIILPNARHEAWGNGPLAQSKSAIGTHPAAVQLQTLREAFFTGLGERFYAGDNVDISVAKHEDFAGSGKTPKHGSPLYHVARHGGVRTSEHAESDASDSRYHADMNVLREFGKSRLEEQVDGLISVRDDVAVALERRAPVVALESTVISHGLPRPHNLATARTMEAVVREAGATPATIGILDGKMIVGLTNEQIAFLAEAEGVAKVSRADVSAVLASGRPGTTTVAGTMFIAARADIHVFATGGIGGVHRGSENTYDISADLTELSRTPVAVVCAGAKAVLDLPRTVEVLETLGIPVVGYGTNEFPAFYSWGSGLPLQHRVDSPDDVARLIRIQWDLGRGQGSSAGIVIVNPPPAESALARAEIESLVLSALEAAELAGIRGKSVTPFLLEELGRTSHGKTLETNIALLIANARLAARIAVAYSAQSSRGQCVVSR